MSCNADTVVESNDVAGVSCAMHWCGHEAIKNVSLSSVQTIKFVNSYKLGWIVAPGQRYDVRTERSANTSVTTSAGVNVDFLSASVGVTVQEGYSKSITISGINDSNRDKYLCQNDYYNGKRAYLSYDKKTAQGNLSSSCKYRHYSNQLNQIGTFDSSKITLVK